MMMKTMVMMVVVVCSYYIVDRWTTFDSGHYKWPCGRTTRSRRTNSSALCTSLCPPLIGRELITRRGTSWRRSTSFRLCEVHHYHHHIQHPQHNNCYHRHHLNRYQLNRYCDVVICWIWKKKSASRHRVRSARTASLLSVSGTFVRRYDQ